MLVVLIAVSSRTDLAQIRTNNLLQDTIRKSLIWRVFYAKKTFKALFGLLLDDMLIALEKLEYDTDNFCLNFDNKVI